MDTLYNDTDALRERVAALLTEHRDLDAAIERLSQDPHFSAIQLQRFKKRKLAIKDEITRLESRLVPDIIA
ncbi:DUF465 domain-containing protein [Fodinicurvata sp. EGI_FJ10296]|uniref:YdcH family protein n=1 Tax=Fodinicurvata sp. EGI_FJ10296 TaxID=3231908 RepID=UPI00345387C2